MAEGALKMQITGVFKRFVLVVVAPNVVQDLAQKEQVILPNKIDDLIEIKQNFQVMVSTKNAGNSIGTIIHYFFFRKR